MSVITGGSRGIGFATALSLASEGWDIALCSRDEAEAVQAARVISDQFGVQALGDEADVADGDAMASFAERVGNEWDSVDLLMCNAAVLGPVGPLARVDPLALERSIEINFLGVINTIRSFWKMLTVG